MDKHPGGIADLSYEPSFIIRGLAEMHLRLAPAGANVVSKPDAAAVQA